MSFVGRVIMREIKFRVWSFEKKEFLASYADSGELFYWDEKWVGLDWFLQCARHENPIRFCVQQYTGLKDQDRAEIWEGDVLKCDRWYYDTKLEEFRLERRGKDCIGHVWYANPCEYIAEWAVSFNHLYSESSSKFTDLRNVGVIGNIFENEI